MITKQIALIGVLLIGFAIPTKAQTAKFCDGTWNRDQGKLGKVTNFWPLLMRDSYGNVIGCVNNRGKVEISPALAAVCPRARLARNMRAAVKHSKRAGVYINACTAKVYEKQALAEADRTGVPAILKTLDRQERPDGAVVTTYWVYSPTPGTSPPVRLKTP